MQITDFDLNGAGTGNDVACGSGSEDVLFGDARWIEERIQALRTRNETNAGQEGD